MEDKSELEFVNIFEIMLQERLLLNNVIHSFRNYSTNMIVWRKIFKIHWSSATSMIGVGLGYHINVYTSRISIVWEILEGFYEYVENKKNTEMELKLCKM